jgi:hypothetical protein
MLNKILLIGVMMTISLGSAWAQEPFAVVELFASEGCSSCPPADDLLRELTQQAQAQGKRIFTLGFEVDYWNNLGWIDPLSKAEFTQRQYQYAQKLGSSSVYTPQMIINGQNAFVGSDEALAKKYIEQSFQAKESSHLVLKIEKNDAQEVELSYVSDQSVSDIILNIALVEDGIEHQVTAGENQGRLLKHDHAVREFKILSLSSKGKIVLTKPPPMGSGRFSVIAFLQNKQSMKVIAADAIQLTN